jgi:ornithine decarboxylase
MKTSMLERLFGVTPTVEDIIRDTIINGNCEDAFYVVDIQDILRKHKNWLLKMPRVQPFYAVKCNSTPIVLELLASLGIGFDCASKAEIDSILSLGVSPNNIIYANPCKTKSFIQHAANVGVDVMTFDNELELYKIRQFHPNARMVLRIKVDDSHSVCRLGLKFGADIERVPHLLQVAKNIGVNIIGCSFHVGSGCESADAYTDAISNAKYVFELGRQLGFDMTLLDIGMFLIFLCKTLCAHSNI